jgi:hypothetical protein
VSEINITERDKKIIREIDRWRICLGRHIKILAGFSGQRACDRRLRKLIDSGYIERKKILYGVPSIYKNTYKAKALEHIPSVCEKIRVENIPHDIITLDTAIYFNIKYGVKFGEMVTEKQLHRLDGFGVRKHQPDFVFTKSNKKICVEIELTLKSMSRFENNMKVNFMDYDTQIWVVPDFNTRIAGILTKNRNKYINIKILELKEVKNLWKTF